MLFLSWYFLASCVPLSSRASIFTRTSLRSRRLEVADVFSCAHYFQAPATQATRALAYFTWFSIPVENKGLLEVDLLRDDPKFWLTKCNIFCLSWYLVSYFVVTKDEEPAKTTHNDPKLFKNYSMSARWIWGGYEALIYNKRKWNNCCIKLF